MAAFDATQHEYVKQPCIVSTFLTTLCNKRSVKQQQVFCLNNSSLPYNLQTCQLILHQPFSTSELIPSQAVLQYLASFCWFLTGTQGSLWSVCACECCALCFASCVNSIRPEASPWLCQGADTHLVFRLQKQGTHHTVTHSPFTQLLPTTVTTRTCMCTTPKWDPHCATVRPTSGLHARYGAKASGVTCNRTNSGRQARRRTGLDRRRHTHLDKHIHWAANSLKCVYLN